MLQAGQMLLHYRLVDKIGEGGMGVVWRAVDTNLDREVAIKTLPPAFAQDTERLARFEREARLLASLKHPHIAAVYGLHEADGLRFIAMELAGGENLAERLRRGPMSIESTLSVARQVAEALEAAHESGVIHRDLKPANITLDDDGRVSVLDFGLAKSFKPEESSSGPSSLSMSPTVTSAGTVAGLILGTASYMSPEQARGKPVDKRTDVWAFGCLLYEMLAGRRLFDGETVSDVLASVLKTDPDWEALPHATPAPIRRLLQRCLVRDPRRRVRDVGDARIEIEDTISGATIDSETAVARPRPGWQVPVLVAGGILAGIVATFGFGELLFSNAPDPQPTSLSYVPPEDRIVSMPMSTPDGRTLLYWGLDLDPDDSSDVWQVFTRPFGAEEAVAIDGSKSGRAMLMISPDGDWVAFVARVAPGSTRQKLYKAPLDRSGPTMAIADWPDGTPAQNPQWLPDGDIAVVTDAPWSVVRIPTDGRPPAAPLPIVTDAPAQRIELVGALPGAGHAIAAIASTHDAGYRQDLYLIDLTDGKAKLLIENGSMATWSSTGHLVFSRLDQLLAVPFDLDRLETTGGPVTVAEGLWTPRPWNGAWFHLSQSGTLLTMPGGGGGDERTLGFLDRSGGYEPWSDLRLAFQEVAVSPDGTHAAFTIDNITEGDARWQIRVSSLDRPRLRTLAAIPGQDCQAPVWMPDSAHLIYRCGSESGGTLWLQRADGSEAARMLMEYGADDPVIEANSVASDGSAVLLYRRGPEPKVLLKALHGDEEPVDLLPGEETARGAQFSPDGRFIVYSSAETGRREIYLRSYRDGRVGPKILVTTSGGKSPVWSKSPRGEGLELFYLNNKLMWSISLTTEPRLSISEPLVQFEDNESRVETGSMLPDGRFFVILTGEQEDGATRIDVTLDWTARLR